MCRVPHRVIVILHLYKLINLNFNPEFNMKCCMAGSFFLPQLNSLLRLQCLVQLCRTVLNGIMQISIVFCTVNRCGRESINNVFLALCAHRPKQKAPNILHKIAWVLITVTDTKKEPATEALKNSLGHRETLRMLF